MLHILGIRLIKEEKVHRQLRKIVGFSVNTLDAIFFSMGCLKSLTGDDLLKSHITKFQKLTFLFRLTLGKEIINEISYKNRSKLSEIKHRKGLRFLQGLPVRGQRTKTNGKTSKRRL